MTLVLCGIPLSNYYNKAKLALLEKGIPFEERVVATGRTDEEVLCSSPLAKVPFMLTPQGPLAESQVICDWLEAAYPAVPLVPADPYEAAKVRELCTFLDLHLELVVRQLYGPAFFRADPLPEKFVARVRSQLERNIPAFQRLAKFSPYVAGDQFTLADCAAYTHLPLVALATKLVVGEDLLAAAGVDWKSYVKFIEQRPTAQKVAADRKADEARLAKMAADLKAKAA